MRITKTVMLHLCGCTLLTPWAGWAQTQITRVPELPSVLVEADFLTSDYLPQSAVSVTGSLPLTLRENPQSVSVVTEKRMQDQNLTTTIDALKWVPGLTFGSQDESEGNTVWSRGYVMDNVMVDGLMIQGGPNCLRTWPCMNAWKCCAGLPVCSQAAAPAVHLPGPSIFRAKNRPKRLN